MCLTIGQLTFNVPDGDGWERQRDGMILVQRRNKLYLECIYTETKNSSTIYSGQNSTLAEMSFPTLMLVLNWMPSLANSSTLLWTTSLDNFMVGIPYCSKPPTRSFRSNTVTTCPAWKHNDDDDDNDALFLFKSSTVISYLHIFLKREASFR